MPRNRPFMNFRRPGDTYMKEGEGKSTDIVIPVMGPTGVGKSTFINNVLDHAGVHADRAETSDGLASMTSQLQHYFVPLTKKMAEEYNLEHDRRLVLVDTPGFDDTNVSDSEILRRIAVWLAYSYNNDMKVGGVVYMYPIYPNRITRNDRSNLKVFQKICGRHGLSKVILATTRWDICPPLVGERREKELRDNFWKEMIDVNDVNRLARMERLRNERESAWGIVHYILERFCNNQIDGVILDLQDQLVRRNKQLKETDAARELRKKLQELLKESGGADTQERRERLNALQDQIQSLKLSFSARVMNFFKR